MKARQAAGASPEDTATRLLGWIEEDPYGFCFGLERDLARVLDKAGLAALVQQVRDRFDAPGSCEAEGSPRPDQERRRWGGVLRALHLEQKDVGAYVAITEQTGLTAKDCHAVATMLAARRKREEALEWVGRGIEIEATTSRGSVASHDLADLRRGLLRKLGREQEALDSAWADYRAHPSAYSYRDLMKFVPSADRDAWHERAIERALGADLHSSIGLLLETKEIDRLAEVVTHSSDDQLERVSDYVLEPAATKLEKVDLGAAARLWRAMGARIVGAGKSKYYQAALRDFERASGATSGQAWSPSGSRLSATCAPCITASTGSCRGSSESRTESVPSSSRRSSNGPRSAGSPRPRTLEASPNGVDYATASAVQRWYAARRRAVSGSAWMSTSSSATS